METVEAGDIGTGHVLPDVDEAISEASSSSSSMPTHEFSPLHSLPSSKKKDVPHENPHKYVRQQVPPSERSLRKPALRNDTPSQAALFKKKKDEAKSAS